MKRTDERLLPLLLICAQAAVWPGAELIRGTLPSGSALLVTALVAGLVTAALCLRRTRPEGALVVVVAACALGAEPLPTGAVAVLGTAGVALALFTVARERDTFTGLLCAVALASWQFLQNITLHGLSDLNGLDRVLTTSLYAAACAAGLLARRAHRARRAAEERLKLAEIERHRLPEIERRRMERELHDVSAHHLTAVVVTAGAALGLRERRPEMVGEALEFAAETGREVTRALGAVRTPAPSREQLPTPQERLRGLVAGFSRLGQRVESEIGPLPDGAVADAVYGVLREALTNVARHAPGAPTTVRCVYGDTRTELLVTSGPSPAGSPAHGAGLGSGRGQGFLRSRAREAGGTLTSGPTTGGGWEVRATLPGRHAATSVERSVPRSYRLAQTAAAAGLVLQPLLPLLVVHTEYTATNDQRVPASVLFALLASAQALALLWRHRVPVATQAVVLGLALLWPVAMTTGAYTGPVLLPPLLSMAATCAVIVSVAAGGPPDASLDRDDRRAAALRLSAGPLTAVVVHASATTAAVLHRGTTIPVWALVAGATAEAALAVGAAWWIGVLRGRRLRAAHSSRATHLASWTEEAVRDAWAERRRIAEGLETTVLARTVDLVAQAEAGRLDAVAERAREALTAMRALLDAVRDTETAPDLRPQPTLQALDLLAHQLRATGREIEIHLTDRMPKWLPTRVDLAAYHACETALAAGGDEPMVLALDVDEETLTLSVTGVPDTARATLGRRLTVRTAAIGGTCTTSPPGPVLVRLPLPATPAVPTMPSAQPDDAVQQNDAVRQNNERGER
ncbi:histidine kinase [Streptomyces sp. NPDC005892]|uniref:histidine kinase n=1 Tax=Streptomyces sp. NPDC005892 TaxID=3155593 RepID=UPI0033E15EF7